jgi:preprotein translocase subunit SecE
MAVEVATRPTGFGARLATFPARVANFYQEVVTEMRKVTWPDRDQLKDTTIKIIIFVLFIGAVLGIVDVLLQLILVEGIPSLFRGR